MTRNTLTTCLSLLAAAILAPWRPGAAEPAAKPPLAPAPPMGWNSWEAFRKDLDENEIKAQADAMVALGLRDAGYTYLVLDGGWKSSERDAAGNIAADPKKFPHGIKALADYLHARGLKLGLHQPAGVKDCGHDEPGSQNHEERDARLFASWGVDFIKYDQCDYIHAPDRTPGAPDIDAIAVRDDDMVIFTAEAESGRLTGMVQIEACDLCSGGKAAVGIGYAAGGVEIDVPVRKAGRYILDVRFFYPYYGQNRDHFKQMTLFVSADGGPRQRLDIPYEMAKRYTAGSVPAPIELKQGMNKVLLDNPSSQEDDVRLSYLKMAAALENSGREIMFSTSGAPRPWLWAEPAAHLWRTAGDITNRWTSIMNTLDRHVDTVPFARPGFWADPDMLEAGAPPRRPTTGNAPPAMTLVEQRSQLSLWAILSAPLFISADLRHLDAAVKSMLLNRDLIAIDQDPLGIPARWIRSGAGVQIFAKRLSAGIAVAILNRNETAAEVRVTAAELGLDNPPHDIRDVWSGEPLRPHDGVISATVEPHAVTLFRLSPSLK